MANRKKSPSKRPKKPATRAGEPKARAVAPKAKADTKVERFRQNLRVILQAQELAEKADRMAHVIGEKENLVAQARSATAHLKAQIKEKDAEIGKLSTQIRDKAEYVEVDCERRFLYRTGKIVEVRLDTEEQTYERAMTLSERQLEIPGAKRDTSQAKASLEKALGHPVTDESDEPGDEREEEEGDEEAPEAPGSDDPPESEPGDDAGDADEDAEHGSVIAK